MKSGLIEIVDAALADAARRAGTHLVCHPGCTRCCHGVFEISALDADRLRRGLDALTIADPPRAARVRERVAAAQAHLGPWYPGDCATGVLHPDEDAIERFEEWARADRCPVLDPGTGTCDLYAHRPVLCRTFGPPMRNDPDDPEAGIAICELCFETATLEEIAFAEMDSGFRAEQYATEAAFEAAHPATGPTFVAYAFPAAELSVPPSDHPTPRPTVHNRRVNRTPSILTFAVTGASGSLFAVAMLQALAADERVAHVDFVASDSALRVFAEELELPGRNLLVERLLGAPCPKITQHTDVNIGANIASGSYPSDAMVVLPCSMGTLAGIAHGLASSLIERAADVALKERRPLVLCVRETPFNQIHLRNMTLAADAGATIYPVMPALYNRPETTSEIARQFVARVLAHIGLPQPGAYVWTGEGA